jgi:nucleotide-binding universal stress UspA family protein
LKTHSDRLLIASETLEHINHLLSFGKALAEAQNSTLQIIGLVAVPRDQSLSTGAIEARHMREALEPLARQHEAAFGVHVAHDIWAELSKAAGEEPETLLLLDLASKIPANKLHALPADIAMVAGAFPTRLEHILLPIRGGPYAELALRIALALAETHHAEITVLHAAPMTRLGDEVYQGFLRHLRELPAITRWVNARSEVVKAIVREARDHQLLVMGAIARVRSDGPPIGPTALRAVNEAAIPTLVVKSRQEFPVQAFPTAEVRPIDYTISVVVDKWFAENSFHASEFADLARLVQLKEKQGLTISLGLPTLNEEATIGKIIQTMKQHCMEQYPLLDEIVVIDSMSTDRTVAIAQELGVPVYSHPEILPQVGSYQGKGEALWKSLAVLKGDIIAWIDTDIVNIHPRFLYGILGPLIRESRLMYVKGYYKRPLRVGSKMRAGEGGRVTELVARPLLNLFYPELSGLVQPLAGEYAGRRSALEQLPFSTGYGVEAGLLIDILNKFGLSVIGQVDLEERIHRNQPLNALGRMSFAIIQTIMKRVGEERGMPLADAMHESLKQIRYGREHFELEVLAISEAERPPMALVRTT